jgi:hypothetical protein
MASEKTWLKQPSYGRSSGQPKVDGRDLRVMEGLRLLEGSLALSLQGLDACIAPARYVAKSWTARPRTPVFRSA